jgi:multimeric flavodoxin WrbA
MNIVIIFGSHRTGGTNGAIEKMLKELHTVHTFDFIHLAEKKVEGCTSCHKCGKTGYCVLPPSQNDHFQEIFDKMIASDAVLIIAPVYAGIPSRLTALFERMTSVLYDTGLMNTDNNPLLNKKVGIFSYCTGGVCDGSALKLIFDKFVMKNYRFDVSTYHYLNDHDFNKYSNIIDYVKDIVVQLETR